MTSAHMNHMLCTQSGCDQPAEYRYTWPGSDEAGICEQHSAKLRGVAQAMGMYIQLIPLSSEEGS